MQKHSELQKLVEYAVKCEKRPVREKFGRLLKVDKGEQPVLLLRIGYSQRMPSSFIRPAKDVIVEPTKKLVYE